MLAALAATRARRRTFHRVPRALPTDGARGTGAAPGEPSDRRGDRRLRRGGLRSLGASAHVPLEIVPNGVDVRAFARPGPPTEGLPAGRKILWVNRLDPQKGFEVMVRRVRAAGVDELEDVRLLVAGDGRDRVVAASLPRDASRARILRWAPCPHAELPRYHAAARRVRVARGRAGELRDRARRGDGRRGAGGRDGHPGLPGGGSRRGGRAAGPAERRDRARGRDPPGPVRTRPGVGASPRPAARERRRYSWDAVVPRLEAVYDRVLAGTR